VKKKGSIGMNTVIIMGHLANEPDVKMAEDINKSVAKYSIGVNRIRGNAGQEEVNYFNCVAFGVRADFADKFLHEGMKVLITGRLHSGSYTNKDGQKIYYTEIIVELLEIVDNKKVKTLAQGRQNGGVQ
jgi:single-strand DNA-binding protein